MITCWRAARAATVCFVLFTVGPHQWLRLQRYRDDSGEEEGLGDMACMQCGADSAHIPRPLVASAAVEGKRGEQKKGWRCSCDDGYGDAQSWIINIIMPGMVMKKNMPILIYWAQTGPVLQ